MTISVFEPGHDERVPHMGYKLVGLLALSITLVLTNGVHRIYKGWLIPVTWLLRQLKRCMRQATFVDAEKQVAAIRWAGRRWPGRVACLETALGAAIAGAVVCRMPVWCVGVKFDPIAYHAWVEAPGQDGQLSPVTEAEEREWPYKTVIRI